MRSQLKLIEGKQSSFIAEFIRYGQLKKGYYDPYEKTILIRRLTTTENNKIVANHLWINLQNNPRLEDYDFKEGDFISFSGIVKAYQKGYKGKRIDLIINRPVKTDYQLSNISDITILNENEIL